MPKPIRTQRKIALYQLYSSISLEKNEKKIVRASSRWVLLRWRRASTAATIQNDAQLELATTERE